MYSQPQEQTAQLDSSTIIRQRLQKLHAEQPKMRPRNAAQALGISECELLTARIGTDVTWLRQDPETMLQSLQPLGEVMALTRNEYCVHERHGVYQGAGFFGEQHSRHGLLVNPDIDLRLFMSHWQYSFAVTEHPNDTPRNSLQFFDKSGAAIHKIYLTAKSHQHGYDTLVQTYAAATQPDTVKIQQYQPYPDDRPDTEIDTAGLRIAWENLQDTHAFHPLLKKFNVARRQAFRLIGHDFAYQVANNAIRQVFEAAKDTQCPIMVFVGNRGCIQIHTGTIQNLVEHGPWYNVLDPMFNLHLREDQIAHIWVTKKPTVDGIVTALEIFDVHNKVIATIFGKRKPGIAELAQWRNIIANIQPLHAQ